MKKIAVITATRAEYGLLSPIIKALRKYENSNLKIDLVVTGTHLSDEYGMTVSEIQERIDYKIPIPVTSASELSISANQAETLVKFTEFFFNEQYNAIFLLGDRYELLAIAIAAGNTRTPIFHISGGDTTEGAIDEWIRHSITKMSYLHFVTNEKSKRRVLQMGENPARVFNYGSTSIDNIKNVATMTKAEALKSVGLSRLQDCPNCQDSRYALCTYHPVTIDNKDVEELINNFLNAMRSFPNLQFIVTKSNADQGGARINELLDQVKDPNIHVFTSLGVKRYLSLMKHAEFVLGNSSSGIIETPALHVPTVNIGDRQRGRLQSESVINCGETTEEIIEAIKFALTDKHKEICKNCVSPYGDGHSAEQVAKKTVEVIMNGRIDLKKKFYDL